MRPKIHPSLPAHVNLKNIDKVQLRLEKKRASYLSQGVQGTGASLFDQGNDHRKPEEGKSMLVDPMLNQSSMGFFEKYSRLGFDTLFNMSHVPVIRAIINTRKDQVSAFTQPQPSKYSKGFVIRKKTSGLSASLPGDGLSARERKDTEVLVSFLENGGDNSNKWHGDNFETFVRKMVEDSLVLDQYSFEVMRTLKGDPYEFVAVDAKTIRIAMTFWDNQSPDFISPDRNDQAIDGYLPSYVQIYQGTVYTEFYPWELCMGIRNPHTDLNYSGYGRSELEDLLQTVTAMLNAEKYNAKVFNNKILSNGALFLKNAHGVNQARLEEIRASIRSMGTGVDNAHNTLILPAEAAEWIQDKMSNRDMEFSYYQQHLIRLACSIYKISPEEIGFNDAIGQRGLGSGRASHKEDLDHSKEKGLAPLLRTLQRSINKYLIGPKSGDKYEFLFVGLDVESERQEDDRICNSIGGNAFRTVNEVRAEKGLPPLSSYYDDLLNKNGEQMDTVPPSPPEVQESVESVNKSLSDEEYWNQVESVESVNESRSDEEYWNQVESVESVNESRSDEEYWKQTLNKI